MLPKIMREVYGRGKRKIQRHEVERSAINLSMAKKFAAFFLIL